MKFNANDYETLSAMREAWKLDGDDKLRRAMLGAANTFEFKRRSLAEGTELHLIAHVADWLKDRGVVVPQSERRQRMIDGDKYETIGIAARYLADQCPRTTVYKAAERSEFHIHYLPFGTPLIFIPSMLKWHKELFEDVYEINGEKMTLSRWAWRYRRRHNIPASKVLSRVREGMSLWEALTTPLRKGE